MKMKEHSGIQMNSNIETNASASTVIPPILWNDLEKLAQSTMPNLRKENGLRKINLYGLISQNFEKI
jgi:hypothetical protein